MSIRLMAQVWEYQFSHSEQSVMLALADHAHDDGTNVRPSIAYISWKTDYSERQAQRILRDLQTKGILRVVRHEHGGRGFATEYDIHLEKGVKKSPFRKKGDTTREKGDIDDIKGDISDEKGDGAVSPQPSIESSEEPSEEPGWVSPVVLRIRERDAKRLARK